jgi:peptidoglycan/LPS O-acetylase OafA/YrhL
MYFPLFVSGIFFYKIYSGQDVKQNYLLVFFSLLCALLHYRSDWYIFISRAQFSLMILGYHAAFLLFVNGKMNFLVNPVTLFLGKISYSLYLVHNFIFASFLVSLLTEKYNVNLWVACFCIAMPASILVAAFLTFFAERPLTKKMRKFFRKTREQATS